MKLYRSTKDTRWFAYGPEIGWVMFPAEIAGWQKRQPARVTDPIDMREVPLRMGFNTGIPGAPMSAGGTSDLLQPEVSRITEHHRKKGKITCLTSKLQGFAGRRRNQAPECPPFSKSA